ncbi:triose-phosphate isomerase [bacterium]|nr:triose-phosphate isomerase [bacterium]
MRKELMAANWKLYNVTLEENVKEAKGIAESAKDADCEVVICPSAPFLIPVKEAIAGSPVKLGAQGVFWEEKGGFTAQISPQSLKDIGCEYVIIGHSETRGRFGVGSVKEELLSYFSETDETVNLKVLTALKVGLKPIICVGETINERKAGKQDEIISYQVEMALRNVEDLDGIVIAYEPVWAIGTGEFCDPEEANRIIGLIRNKVREQFGEKADEMRILYGGSVDPNNIASFMEKEEVDGALVGRASAKAESFSKIIHYK